MPTAEEIKKIIEWCEKKKKEENRLVLVLRNPFREEIPWTYRYPLIEIDRPLEVASKNSLVYDSSTKSLWHYYLDAWRKIEPDFEAEE